MSERYQVADGFSITGGAVTVGPPDDAIMTRALSLSFRIVGSDEPVQVVLLLDENGARNLVRAVTRATAMATAELRQAQREARSEVGGVIGNQPGQGVGCH